MGFSHCIGRIGIISFNRRTYEDAWGCSYSSAKRDSSFRWAFLAALAQARPGLRTPPAVLRPLVHGSGIQAQFCAAFRCRPARRDDVVGGPSGLGRAAGHAPDDRRRSPSAACPRLQWARQAAGIGGWRVSAGRRGQAPPAQGQAVEKGPRTTARMGGHTCTGARPLKGDPAMQLLGQEPLRRAKSIREWQDSRAVHDSRASDGESAPWRQDARAVYSPTALCGAFWIHATHILPKLAVFEYMQAICCHEPAFFPSEAPSGMHRGTILPWPAAWGYIRAQSCHGRQLGNASGRYLAMAMRRMTAAEVHRRPISGCNGDERAMFKTPFVLLKGLIAFLSTMRLLSNLLIIMRSVPTSTMKPAHKDAPRGNTEGKEEP